MSSAPSGRSGGGGSGLVSSAVRSGPSRAQTVKGLNAAFASREHAGHNRYKFQGFNARIQNIRINFRSLLEPHEIAADEQAAAARIDAATAYTAARSRAPGSGDVSSAVVVEPTEQFSSASLTTMDAEGAYSYFSASLSHLSGLQLHRDFLAFLDVMRKQGSASSFPLLLRNQKHVVDALLSHASVPGSQAQRELFKLISVLARDLQREFYPYMGRVMTTLLSLLDASDSDNVQAVFQTLASLFKSQARHIGADLSAFFDEYFEELLGHDKNYVRHFASETVAYLLRTVERENGVNTALPSVLRYTASRGASEAFKDGLASTLFEVVKNTRFAFQSSHAANVAALLQLLHAPAAALDKVASGRAEAATVAPAALALKERAADYHFELQLRMHRRMANYTRRDQSKEVWSVLIKQMSKRHTQAVEMLHTVTAAAAAAAPKDAAAIAAAELNSSRLRALSVECSRLLQLLALWSSHRGGSRLPDHALMRRVLDMAFGPLFFAGQQHAAVELKAQSAHMLEQYWSNFPAQFGERVKPFLDKLLSLPVTTAPMAGVATAAAAAAAAKNKSGAATAAPVVVDAVGVENASLMLSFLESVRNLQSGELDSLAPRVQAAAQALLLTPALTEALGPVARSLGLALLLEINGLHPGGASGGSSYRIQALDEFHRATLTGEAARRRRRELRRARLAAAGTGSADADGEDEEEDGDEEEDEVDGEGETAADVVEEEVDPSAYATPLPQASLYSCSAFMYSTLRLGAPVQAWLVQQVLDALLEGQWSAAGVAATAAASEAEAAHGSTLVLPASSSATRASTLWSILQLLPTSGLDVSLPLSSIGIALSPKQLGLLRSLVPQPPEVEAAQPAGEALVAEVLLALAGELGARITETESKAVVPSSNAGGNASSNASSNVTVFTASTPLDSTAGADAAEDSSAETNTHMLVGHVLLDQLHFLRAQALISLATLAKHRWSRADQEKLLSAPASSPAPSSPLLPVLRALAHLSLGALRTSPTHVATLAALDKVFEMAKSAQVDGVLEPRDGAADAHPGPSKSAKKKKASAAAAAAPATAAGSSTTAGTTEFLRALFSKRAFREQSPLFLPCISSAHAFLRSTSLSVLRYYTTLRFEAADVRGVAPSAEAADADADADADGDESMQPGGAHDDDEAAEGSKSKLTHTSELVGECPMLELLHSLSTLAPTLEFEKEFVRLLKKMEVLIQSGRVPDLYMRLVPSALLGLLHLKLNPLWAHVQKVLSSSFVQRYCVTEERQQWMWNSVVRPKLDEIAARTQLLLKVDLEEEEAGGEDGDEEMMEKHHARVAASASASSAAAAAASAASASLSSACVPRASPTLLRFSHFVSLPSRSTDSFTYQSLLYASFSLDVASSGGKYGAGQVVNGFAQRLFNKTFIQAEIIQTFLEEVWNKEYLVCFPNTNRIEEGMVDDDDEQGEEDSAESALADAQAEAEAEDEEDFFSRASSAGSSNLAVPRGFRLRSGARKLVRQKLLLFLRLFLATFHKAGSGRLPRANTLRNLFLSLLTKKEEEVQRLALAALAKFQMAYLTPYLSLLQSLIAESTWRDAMTGFNLAPEGGMVAPEHRRPFAALLIRILYPKLVQRKLVGKAGKGGSLSARRAAILSFFGGLASSELEHLLFLVMGGHFRTIVNKVVRAREEEEREEAVKMLPKGKRAAAAAAAASAGGSSTLPQRGLTSETLTFEQILDMQVPLLNLPAGSQALQRALLNPLLYDSRTALRLPTSKQLGFLHMLNFFLSKLRTLSIPYLKFFVIQCSFMLLNADVQLDKYRGRMAKEAEAEAEAAKESEADVEMEAADDDDAAALALAADHDDEDEEDEAEDDSEENDDADAEEEEGDAEGADSKQDAVPAPAEEEFGGVDSDDEAPAARRPSKKGGVAGSKKAVPHALSKYLSELREVRQLALTRMATILEQYPALFADSDEALPFPFKPLADPSGSDAATSGATNSRGEEVVLKLEGPTLAPYLRFFLHLCWPSLLKLSSEGTQHAGGLWSCMVHLASHHRLLVHYLASDVQVLQVAWKDEAKRVGVQLHLRSASTLKLLPAGGDGGEAMSSPFPLFTLLQQSLGARSVHGAVVSAILSISEALLRAKEEAASWEATRAEMEEIEAERREKRAAQVARAKERRRNGGGNKVAAPQVGRAFRDESSDEEGEDSEEDVALSHRLVQIETLYLSPLAHSARVRQHFLSHLLEPLQRIWTVNVDVFLVNMHRWISHLSMLHHASNGRGLPAQANSALVSKSLTRKAAAAAASKAKRGGRAHTSTFFPRRELEVVSSISSFASSARTAKLLVDLLVPFLHSAEKQFLLLNLHAHNTRKSKSTRAHGGDLERYKPPPTLHNTLLNILLHLAPLLPINHVEQLLEQLHRLLFSLRSNTHRSLLKDLYVQLASSPAITGAAAIASSGDATAAPSSLLPLYAPMVAALNALNERRIEEYDDRVRGDMYASLDAAFEEQIVRRELALLDEAEAQQAAGGELSVAQPEETAAKPTKLSKKAARAAASNPLLAAAAANKAEAPQTPLGIRRAALLERQSALELSSSSSVSTATAKSLGAATTPRLLDGFFLAYFSPDARAHARAQEMLRPLLFNFAHDLLDEDLSIRAWGATMLQKLIAFLALPHPHAPVEPPPRDDVASQSADMQRALALRDPLHVSHSPPLLSAHLYPLLKRALKNPVDKIRREVVHVLRALVLAFPVPHRHLLVLVDPSNADQDFLLNIVDISLPTRGRAINRLFQRVTVQDSQNPDLFHAVAERAVDPATIVQVVLPLLHHFIYDTSGSMSNVSSAEGGGASAAGHSGTMSSRMVAAKTASDNTVLEASIRLGGKLSAYLPWAAYYHQIQVYLKLLRARPALERVLVRLVCAFIREWHFDVEETATEVAERLEARARAAKEEAKEARKVAAEQRRRERQARGLEAAGYEEEDSVEEDAPMEDAAATAAATAAAAASAAAAAAGSEDLSPSVLLSRKIRSILSSRLLPQLHSLLTGLKVKAVRASSKSKSGKAQGMETTYENQNELTSKSGMAGGNRLNNTLELVRVPVAMAMVALLRKLPEAIFHAEFPRLLTALCLQLQHREQQARDLTRATLLDILQLLGPYYFHFFVAELGRHLTNGYQLQVLGHVVFQCLDTLVNKMRVAPGSIDHSIVPLMDILMNDLMGEPAKQREVAAIRAATKEARVGHAQDCFQLLASVIGFPGSIHYLVDPFRLKCAESGLRLREINLLAETLKKIATGLHHNESVNANLPSLLVYIHNYLFRNVHESFALLFPRSQQEGKLSKQDKKATSSKQNRHRKLDMTADKNPLEQIREENKARSEGRMAALQGRTVASRKAMEFIAAIQSSQSGQSLFERKVAAAKPHKDDTFLLVKPAPAHAYSFEGGVEGQGHHSNLIIVFGLNLLYYCLKNKKLATNLSASRPSGAAAAASSSSQALVPAPGTALDASSNLARLDPFLHLIRDYCLVMGSALGADTNAGTKSRLTKEGDKKTTRTMLAHSSSAVIHVALKCSEYLLQMPGLPSLPSYLRDLTNYMFGLIHSKAAPHILSVCYSCLAGILRSADWKACGMSAEKQKLLLNFIKAEVMAPTASSATSVAFRLLQAILSRGAELPELYDFIIVVSQLLVTSEVEEVRKQCSAAVYSFLYNYKLGAARLHTHLGYLLNQLSYPHATGRAAVLNLLHTIFSHFAPEVLEEQLEFLFLPLVVHMVNESASENRRALTQALGVLLAKVSRQKQMDVMRMVYGWWEDDEKTVAQGGGNKKKGKKALAAAAAAAGTDGGDDTAVVASSPRERSPQAQLLQSAALHVVSIMADLLKGDFAGPMLLGRTVAGLARIVREQLAAWAEREAAALGALEEEQTGAAAGGADGADDSGAANDVGSSWRVLYSTLLALEKLFRHIPGPTLTAHLQQHEPTLFSDLLSTLTYPHTWVRTVACRIVGFVLSAIPMAAFQPAHAREQLAATLLGTPQTVFRLVRALTAQLQSPYLTDALSDQIVKNLVWVSLSAHHMGGGDLWEGLEGDAQADADATSAEAEAAEADAEEAEAEDDEGAEDDEDVEMEDGDEAAGAAVASSNKKKPSSSSSSSASASSGGKSAPSFPKSDNRVLNWLFTRLSYMCRRDDGIKKRESIFRYFATMASSLPGAVFAAFLLQVVNPLYRVAEGQNRPDEAGLAEFARGVLELVQKQAGTAAFVAAYGHVRGQVAAVRQQRSAKKKQTAVLNPAQAAQRKQHRNDNKRTSKKRKIQMLKSQKGRAQLGIGAGAASALPAFDGAEASSKKQRHE